MRPVDAVPGGAAPGVTTPSAAVLDAAGRETGTARDRLVDAVRAASVAVVVLGHWLMASVSVPAAGGDHAAFVRSRLTRLWRPVARFLPVVPAVGMVGLPGQLSTMSPRPCASSS
ncbi:hypothetical protein E1262_05210 [Jiangella aurantiaca]|uniref:Acyltransferase n=1 Tax=Jiangella aurantiaca TaxID=2530373 RepID=A0A4R5AKM4_9ACTN|nr:hypothetical protein [Jiangella aurantiaca]TDD71554.1 hypothetical protein E1262_05210 [Jiangella aurantiaca]